MWKSCNADPSGSYDRGAVCSPVVGEPADQCPNKLAFSEAMNASSAQAARNAALSDASRKKSSATGYRRDASSSGEFVHRACKSRRRERKDASANEPARERARRKCGEEKDCTNSASARIKADGMPRVCGDAMPKCGQSGPNEWERLPFGAHLRLAKPRLPPCRTPREIAILLAAHLLHAYKPSDPDLSSEENCRQSRL